jgi:hypothetical protein
LGGSAGIGQNIRFLKDDRGNHAPTGFSVGAAERMVWLWPPLLQFIEPGFGRLFRFAKNLVRRNAQQHDHHGGGGNNGWQKSDHGRKLPDLIEKPARKLRANLSNQF